MKRIFLLILTAFGLFLSKTAISQTADPGNIPPFPPPQPPGESGGGHGGGGGGGWRSIR